MKSSKSLKPPLLLTISCTPYVFSIDVETTSYTYLMKTWRAIVVIPSQSFKHTITLRIPVKTDWLCYLGCRQAEETVVSRGFTLVVVTNYIRQLERKLVQIILEGLPPQSLTSKPLNKHLGGETHAVIQVSMATFEMWFWWPCTCAPDRQWANQGQLACRVSYAIVSNTKINLL